MNADDPSDRHLVVSSDPNFEGITILADTSPNHAPLVRCSSNLVGDTGSSKSNDKPEIKAHLKYIQHAIVYRRQLNT